MSSDTVQIHELAKRGAEARIEELNGEIEAIRRMFPDIEGNGVPARIRHAASAKTVKTLKVSGTGPKKAGKRSGWSASARKAVGLRMKKYWAARKKAEAEKKKAA
jgi:hypothetical protein